MRSDEFAQKVSAVVNELEFKINDRPTQKQVKHSLEVLDGKYENMGSTIGEQISKIVKTQNNFDSELRAYHEDIEKVNATVAQKLNLSEGQRIWRNFQRFAEYQDLKDLYMKCIPQLSTFDG